MTKRHDQCGHAAIRGGPTTRRWLLAIAALFLAAPVHAATSYVATTGNDGNSCTAAQSISTPKQTVGSAVTCLSAGDTLYIRAGIYTEMLQWFGWPGGTQGTSWATAVTISAYPSESVTIKGPRGADWVVLMRGSASDATDAPRYIILNGITFDGSDLSNDSNQLIGIRAWDNTTNPSTAPAHHIRFQNGRITGIPHGQGILITWGSDGVELLAMEVDHINGPTTIPNNTQGIYGAANDLIVDGCHFHDNWGYGISNISSVAGQDNSRQTIRNNRVHDNGKGGTGLGGINLGEGTGNLIYNNVVYNNGGPGIILAWGGGSTGTGIYNNTSYNNSGAGILVNGSQSGTIVRNNVSYLNAGGNYSNSGSGTVEDHNSMGGADPYFIAAQAGDFHLQPTSPLIDTAVTLSTVTTDFSGMARPQGAGYDIGAYELTQGRAVAITPTNLRVVQF